MKLIKDRIVQSTAHRQKAFLDLLDDGGPNHPAMLAIAEARGVTPTQVVADFEQDIRDFITTGYIAAAAQTVLFKAEQALALVPALKRFDDQPFFKLPFPNMILQFDEYIPEKVFFQEETDYWHNDERMAHIAQQIRDAKISRELYEEQGLNPDFDSNDAVIGIVLGQELGACNAIAYFASGEIQRVRWMDGDQIDQAARYVNPSTRPRREEAINNKLQLVRLAMACVFYLNCKNITLDKVVPVAKKNNAKRAKKGKAVFGDYYITRVIKTKAQLQAEVEEKERGEPSGRHVTFRFDCRGFFRRLENGSVIWVSAHQRGLAYEEYRPKVYKANPKELG